MPGLVLFDFDGVIADSLDVFHQACLEVFSEHGLQRLAERETFLSLFDNNFYLSLLNWRVSPEQIQVMMKQVGSKLEHRFINIPPCDGIEKTVTTLNERNYELIIITSNLSDIVSHWLYQHQLLDSFRVVLGADKGLQKTEKMALATSNSLCRPAYYVGDTLGDMIEARQAGLKSMGAAWGWHNKSRLERGKPDYLFSTPAELLSVLK
ncbi:HAD family hydrolase [Spongorhabdus nitratireducens]